jgi:hypothetical protein
MSGSGTRKGQEELKNKAMIVVRNATKQEVTNVIFPNGITIGTEGRFFQNGVKIHGNTQVAGILNSEGLRINGIDILTLIGGAPSLFLDVDSNVFAFDNESDTAASPSSIVLTAHQVSQSSTIPGTAFQVSGSNGANLTASLGSDTIVETSAGNCIRTVTLTYNNSTMRSHFPLTTKIVHQGLESTKKISKVQGGADGAAAPRQVRTVHTVDFTTADLEPGSPGSSEAHYLPIFNIYTSAPPVGLQIANEEWDQARIDQDSDGDPLGFGMNVSGLEIDYGKPYYSTVFWIPTGSSSITVSSVVGHLNLVGMNAAADAEIGISIFETKKTVDSSDAAFNTLLTWKGNLTLGASEKVDAAVSGVYAVTNSSSYTLNAAGKGIALMMWVEYDAVTAPATPGRIGAGTAELDITLTYS